MDLPNLFSSAPKKDKLFLGLLMTETTVQAVLWKIASKEISIIKQSEPLHYTKEEDIVIKTDQALQELGELSENLSEVLLSVESTWANESGVVDAKKPLLKKLSEDLSLKPIGYVVTTEAITQYLGKKDNGLNSLVLFYAENKISVSLIENGNIQKTESVVRSDDAISDLTEALARFKSTQKKQLPNSIKLVSVNISAEELFEQQQFLIGHDWEKDGHFISTPVIDNLPLELSLEGVIHQGGLAVAKSNGIEISSNEKQDVKETDGKDFNFKDVTPQDKKVDLETKPSKDDDNLTAVPKSFGIPINSTKLPKIERHEELPMDEELAIPTATKTVKPKKKSKPNKLVVWFKHHQKFALIGFISGLLALVAIFAIFITFSGSALVSLTLNHKPINKDIVITLDPTVEESNFKDLTLKSELVSKNFFFNQTNETTGVTLVGEKAKGKVQLTNKTDGVKTFAAGTSLVGNGIRFTLDDDVTIASASVEIKADEEVKTYGSSEANITAVKIGAEANLETDSTLTVGDFATSSYEARVLETLTGGSSREIRVVSEEDLNVLMLEVKKKILEIAAQEYKDDSDNDKNITFISTNNLTVTEKNYSGEEGDEAKTLSLEVSADVEAISFANQDIKPLAEAVLDDLVPEGFEISDKEPQILSDVNEESATGSAILIDANISTQAIPIIDYEALKAEIANKKTPSALSILTGKSDIKDAIIELTPKILESIWNKLPKDPQKIEFKIN